MANTSRLHHPRHADGDDSGVDAALIGRRCSGREALQRSLTSAVLPLTLFLGPLYCSSPPVLLTDTSEFLSLMGSLLSRSRDAVSVVFTAWRIRLPT